MVISAIAPQGITVFPTTLPATTLAFTALNPVNQADAVTTPIATTNPIDAVTDAVNISTESLTTTKITFTTSELATTAMSTAIDATAITAAELDAAAIPAAVMNPSFVVTGGLDATMAGTLLGGLGLGRGLTPPEPTGTRASGPIFPLNIIPDVAPTATTAPPFDPYSDTAEANLAQITYTREMLLLSAQREAAHALNLMG